MEFNCIIGHQFHRGAVNHMNRHLETEGGAPALSRRKAGRLFLQDPPKELFGHSGRTLTVPTDYMSYYHRHGPHRFLAQDCPEPRVVEPPDQGKIIELPLLGGLQAHPAQIR